MRKRTWGVIALAALSIGVLFAQKDIVGTWQGTLVLPNAPQNLRIVFKVSKEGAAQKGHV